jgi:hypothetical protein
VKCCIKNLDQQSIKKIAPIKNQGAVAGVSGLAGSGALLPVPCSGFSEGK